MASRISPAVRPVERERAPARPASRPKLRAASRRKRVEVPLVGLLVLGAVGVDQAVEQVLAELNR